MATKKKDTVPVERLQALSQEVETSHLDLVAEIIDISEGIRKLRDAHADRLNTLLIEHSRKRTGLLDYIKANPQMFARPKSIQIGEVKSGMRKLKGSTVLPDDTEKLLKQLKAMFGAEATKYIKTEEKPKASAIGELSGGELKKLGVTIESDRDEPFVAITKSAVEAEVDTLLKQIGQQSGK